MLGLHTFSQHPNGMSSEVLSERKSLQSQFYYLVTQWIRPKVLIFNNLLISRKWTTQCCISNIMLTRNLLLFKISTRKPQIFWILLKIPSSPQSWMWSQNDWHTCKTLSLAAKIIINVNCWALMLRIRWSGFWNKLSNTVIKCKIH